MAEVVHRGASEADAGRILQDITDGKVTINDLLGSLYNKGESPAINIPPGVTRARGIFRRCLPAEIIIN